MENPMLVMCGLSKTHTNGVPDLEDVYFGELRQQSAQRRAA